MSLAITLFGMKLGRRKTILLGNGLICIGAALQAATYSVAQIVVGRIICGFGIGCIASSVPTYMAEMSLEAKERGPEISYQGALLITGVVSLLSTSTKVATDQFVRRLHTGSISVSSKASKPTHGSGVSHWLCRPASLSSRLPVSSSYRTHPDGIITAAALPKATTS